VSTPAPDDTRSSARFAEKQRGEYRFSILLIDDMPRIGLKGFYRITIRRLKEINMNRFLNTALAAFIAVALSFGSIGAIVSVPSAQAAAPTAFAMPALA
jgi:hypothetical protein